MIIIWWSSSLAWPSSDDDHHWHDHHLSAKTCGPRLTSGVDLRCHRTQFHDCESKAGALCYEEIHFDHDYDSGDNHDAETKHRKRFKGDVLVGEAFELVEHIFKAKSWTFIHWLNESLFMIISWWIWWLDRRRKYTNKNSVWSPIVLKDDHGLWW